MVIMVNLANSVDATNNGPAKVFVLITCLEGKIKPTKNSKK